MLPEQFLSEMQRVGQNVSRETFSHLVIYEALLRKWQAKINLVADNSLQDLWQRHFLDSAQLLSLLPPGEEAITDLGSGAGFPGLILAIMTNRQVHLIESDQRKSAFLLECARQTNSLERVKIHTARIEKTMPWKAPIITARALAALDQLLLWVEPYLSPQSMCFFLKGAKAEDELTQARTSWNMVAERYPSLTDSRGVILKLYQIERRK